MVSWVKLSLLHDAIHLYIHVIFAEFRIYNLCFVSKYRPFSKVIWCICTNTPTAGMESSSTLRCLSTSQIHRVEIPSITSIYRGGRGCSKVRVCDAVCAHSIIRHEEQSFSKMNLNFSSVFVIYIVERSTFQEALRSDTDGSILPRDNHLQKFGDTKGRMPPLQQTGGYTTRSLRIW